MKVSCLLFAMHCAFCAMTPAATNEPGPIRTLAKGTFSGIQEPTQQVIKDEATWKQIWTRHGTGGRAVPDRVPEVDFAKEMVVAATLGRQHTGGFSIEVMDAKPVGDRLQISIKRTSPPPGAMTI